MEYPHVTTEEIQTSVRVMADNYTVANLTRSHKFNSTVIGESVPNYKERIRNGENATGGYVASKIKPGKMVPGQFVVQTQTLDEPYYSNSQSVIGHPGSPSTTLDVTGVNASKAKAIALAKTYQKIQQELSHMNSLASLAEFHDVVRQFGAPAAAIVDLSNKRLNRLELERRGLKGSVAFKRAKWYRILASTWLEYSFGLAPLVDDTRKAAEALARFEYEKSGEARFRKRIVARGEDRSVSVVNSEPFPTSASWIYLNSVTKDTSTARCQYTVGLQTSHVADFGSNARLLQLLGITPGNLITAAWEAVPWSWLVDYFTNVQQILNASATSTSGVAWVCESVSSVAERTQIWSLNNELTSWTVKNGRRRITGMTNKPCEQNVIATRLTRRSVESLGVPPLYFELPSKPGQLANMAALLFARKAKSSALWLF